MWRALAHIYESLMKIVKILENYDQAMGSFQSVHLFQVPLFEMCFP